MSKKSKTYVLILNRKILLSTVILLLITSIFLLKNTKFIEIFSLKQKSIKTIVIDPGHGGIDGGTNDEQGFLEKNVNLDISLKLKNEFEKENFNVVMTREEDKSLEDLSDIKASRYRKDLDARKNIINNSEPVVFVSIHVNANVKSKKARGIKIYYHPTSDEGMKLAESICNSINKNVYKEFLKNDTVKAIVLPEDYYVLRETTHTGVLVETGFITNPIDKELLENDKYRMKVALSIKEGIITYIEQVMQ